MKIGLIDVDSHRFPNLCTMKISAFHKARGDAVGWWNGFEFYDTIYMSKVFTSEYSNDIDVPFNSHQMIKGGTGYGLDNVLPSEIENHYPDYSLYPTLTQNTAFGFLTRGCPNACKFCLVSEKEGTESVQVGDIDQFWRGQQYIKLLDPNFLACCEHEMLLQQLVQCEACVDFTQGLDIRRVTSDNITLLNQVKSKMLRFAWDNPKTDLTGAFQMFLRHSKQKDPRKLTVYVLTNFNSSHEEDLWRIYALRDIGFTPYVMIYNKSTAPQHTRHLQRWCNNRYVFWAQPDFSKFDPKLA